MAQLQSYFGLGGYDDPLIPQTDMAPAPLPGADAGVLPATPPPPGSPPIQEPAPEGTGVDAIKPCQRAGTCPDASLGAVDVEVPPSLPTPPPSMPPPPLPGGFVRPDAPAADIAPYRTPEFMTNRFSGDGAAGAMRFGPGNPLSGVGSTFAGAGGEGADPRVAELLRRLLAGVGGGAV